MSRTPRQARGWRNTLAQRNPAGRLSSEKWITRSMLRSRPSTLFAFGDNLERAGFGGQAREMRGEPNAVGIPTKRSPSMGRNAFFTDLDLHEVQPHIDNAFDRLKMHLLRGGDVVWPQDGVGTGLARLPQEAPRIAAYILSRIEDLKNAASGVSTVRATENPKDGWAQVAKFLRLATGSPAVEPSPSDKNEQAVARKRAEEMVERLRAAGVPEPKARRGKTSTPAPTPAYAPPPPAPSGEPTPAFQEKRGPVDLPPCSEKPDLYILPITPPMLSAYIQATLLYMSERDDVVQLVQNSSSTASAVHALQTTFNLDSSHLHDPNVVQLDPRAPQARTLVRLRIRDAKSDWDTLKTHRVEKGLGAPPAFGVYSWALGTPGSDKSIQSCFGAPGTRRAGAFSLTDLYNAWSRSRVGRDHPPTFFRAGTDRGVPVVLVVTGRADNWLRMLPGESAGERVATRPAYMDQIPVVQALLGFRNTRPENVCLLLPEPFPGRNTTDMTNQGLYQSYIGRLSVREYLEPLYGVAGGGTLPDREDNLRQAQILAHPPTFTQAKRSPGLFYGSPEELQRWPERFIAHLSRSLDYGWTREEVDARLAENGIRYADFVVALSEDRRGLRQLVNLLERVPARQAARDVDEPEEAKPEAPLHVSSFDPEEWAQILFVPNLLWGDPEEAPYLPARVTLYRKGVVTGDTWFLPETVLQRYISAEAGKRKSLLPATVATVGLYKLSSVKHQLGGRAVEAEKVLKKEALSLPGQGGEWFFAVPPAVSEQAGKTGVHTSWSSFYPGKSAMLYVARSLLRVDLVPGKNGYGLQLVSGGDADTAPGELWTSKAVPYLLNALPLRTWGEDENGKNVQTGTKTVRLGDDDYGDALAEAFRPAGVPDVVRQGRTAVFTGRERTGGTVRGGKRPSWDVMATKSAFMPKGLYLLAKNALSLLAEKPKIAVKSLGWLGSLHRLITSSWPEILSEMNAERAENGESLLPRNTPVGVLETDPRIELEAVDALGRITASREDTYRLFLKKGLLKPWPTNVPEQWDEAFETDVLEHIKAIENPGARTRRARRPRQSSRRNPVKDESALAALQAWAERPTPETASVAQSASEPHLRSAPSERDLAAAMAEFFPRRETRKKLAPSQLFRALGAHDIVSRFGSPEPLSEEVAAAAHEKLLRYEEPLGVEAFRKHVAEEAEISAQDALSIHRERLKSKTEGRTVSASGALCKLYRNSSRLKGYTPPAPVLSANTCWILIGPPTETGSRTRVMSYRNGAHVDCDMSATTKQPFGRLLAKAIEGMVLWIAEKPTRLDRIDSINLAQAGTPAYRVLWTSGSPLDPHKMLERAYREAAQAVPWSKAQVDADRKNYEKAVGQVRPEMQGGAFERVKGAHKAPEEAPSMDVMDEDLNA